MRLNSSKETDSCFISPFVVTVLCQALSPTSLQCCELKVRAKSVSMEGPQVTRSDGNLGAHLRSVASDSL